MHIDALRPIVRVVLSDAVKQWAASLLQARPVLRTGAVFDVVDRLLNPLDKPPPLEAAPAQPAAQPTADTAAPTTPGDEPARRARLIFHAAEEAKPFDPADLNFEFDEKASNEVPEELSELSPVQPMTAAAPRKGSELRAVDRPRGHGPG